MYNIGKEKNPQRLMSVFSSYYAYIYTLHVRCVQRESERLLVIESTARSGGGVFDSNDSNASTHHGEQSVEVPSSKCSVNAVQEYKSDDSVKRKHCDDKATSSTSKTSILSQNSVGSFTGAVPVEPKPFDGVSSNPPHYIRPPQHSSSGDKPPQFETVEGSLSETESIRVVDQSLPQYSLVSVYMYL